MSDRTETLPPLLVEIVRQDTGELDRVVRMEDPRGEFCKTFNRLQEGFGFLARPRGAHQPDSAVT
jgi:hypothetical protein